MEKLISSAHYVAKTELEPVLVSRGYEPDLSITSLPEVNRKLWGIKKRGLTLIGARTSHGKSAMALQIAFDLAMQRKKVLFLSLEMTNVEMVERLFCYDQQVDNYALLTGHFEKYRDKYDAFVERIHKMPLILSDCIGKNWEDIDKIVSGENSLPDCIIVDYIQAIKSTKKNLKESIDDYILHFREMAIRHNFAALLCSQINRESQDEKDKSPKLHHLKNSGALEEIADAIILLWWKYKTTHDETKKNEYTIFIEKNRNGRTGYKEVKYYPEFYKFVEEEKTVETPTEKNKDKEIKRVHWND